jgi:DNA-binding CsgD family transcriptional regulator
LEREREAAAVAHAVRRAREGEGGAVLIEGSAGIGKTALLGWSSEHAANEGLQVLSATARELERGFPFGLALQLFEPAFSALDADQREQALSGAASPVGSLLGAPAPSAALPDESFAIVHGLYWLAVSLCERRPLALLVDDLHWGDVPSLQALAYLAPRAKELPLLLLMTRRTGEPDAAKLDWLGAGGDLELVHPSALSAEATAEILRTLLGPQASRALCEACHGATGGNPFLVRELARTIKHEALDRDESAAERIAVLAPESVSRATLARIQALDPAARELAKAVAVLERSELRHAAALADLDEATAAEAAAALADTGVLAVDLPLRFAHPILRAAVYSDLPAPTREISHRRAARLLADAGVDPDLVASHLLESEPRDEAWAVEALRAAARQALVRGAPQIAGRLLKRTLAESPRHPERSAMLLERAHAYLLGGHRKTFAALNDVVGTSEEPLTRATALAALGLASAVAGDARSASAAARRGLDEIAGHNAPELEARLLALYTVSAYGDPDVARELGAALEHAQPAESSLADAARAAGLAVNLAWRGESVDEVAALARRALADERLLALGVEGFLIRGVAGFLLAPAGDVEEALAVLEGMLAVARERGSPMLRGATANFLVWCRWMEQGVLPEALAEVEVLEAVGPPWEGHAGLGFVVRSDVLIDRGDIAGAARAMAMADEVLARTRHFLADFWHPVVRSRLRLEQGDAEGALADASRAGEESGAAGAESPALCAWRSWAALAAARLGDHDRARRLCHDELRLARRSGARRAIGAALRTAGSIDPGEEGIARLREATEVLAGSPAWLERAKALVDLGAALRRAGRRSQAGEPLREGMDLAHRCGATAVVERAQSELRAMGSRPRRLALSGRQALTPSELRVCELAARGLNNREIAERLFVTRRTVETHLTHAYQKLDISTRGELEAALTGDGA